MAFPPVAKKIGRLSSTAKMAMSCVITSNRRALDRRVQKLKWHYPTYVVGYCHGCGRMLCLCLAGNNLANMKSMKVKTDHPVGDRLVNGFVDGLAGVHDVKYEVGLTEEKPARRYRLVHVPTHVQYQYLVPYCTYWLLAIFLLRSVIQLLYLVAL
jgi:hypothetical protein